MNLYKLMARHSVLFLRYEQRGTKKPRAVNHLRAVRMLAAYYYKATIK